MTTEIKTLIDKLADIHAAIDLLNIDRQAQIDALLTPEVRAQISDIEAEFGDKVEAAKANIEELQAQVKAMVLEHGESVKGARMQASFTKGRVSWDAKALDGYAVNHPELFAFRKEGEPSVSFRWHK